MVPSVTHSSDMPRAQEIASDSGVRAVSAAPVRGRKPLSAPQQLMVGTLAGLSTAAASQLIRAADDGARLAPPLSHALITTGATIAGFSQMSTLRTRGGDPYHYGAWRTAGLSAAVAIPLVDCLLASSARSGAVDPALTYSWQNMGLIAANAGLGGYLQKLLDERPHGPQHAARLRLLRQAVGASFLVSLACHAGILLRYASAAADGHESAAGAAHLPGSAHAAVLAGAALCLVGASGGWVARTPLRNESARVAGFTIAVAGVLIALWGASKSSTRDGGVRP